MRTHDTDIGCLYKNEKDRLRAFVNRLVRNSATAEDMVQQAFANVLGRNKTDILNAAYITTTVRNLTMNHLRDLKRKGEIMISDAALEQYADSRPSPEMTALYRSELRKLLTAVASLPDRRRQAFVMNRIENMSYAEIAEHMQISRHTVISHVVAALAELDQLLSTN